MKFTILGCGNSTGVPSIGDVWGACDPKEPKNRRGRCSLLVESKTTKLVIDTGPDFREQLTRVKIPTVDAILYTHSHDDHVMGISDIRSITFRNKKITPVYGSAETLDEITQRFDYHFKGGKSKLYPPILQAMEIKDFGVKNTIGDIDFVPFHQDHGTCITTGYRFGDFAYSVDFISLEDAAVNVLKGVKTWVVDAAGYKEPRDDGRLHVHANLDTIYELNKRVGASQVYLTSLSLAMDYKTLTEELRAGYAPAYDGLSFTI